VEDHIAEAMLFDSREDLIRYGLGKMQRGGMLLEVGVYQGRSINLIAKLLSESGDARPIYGFDSFEELSEDWYGNAHTKRGPRLDQGGVLPAVADNVRLLKGWIDDTLPVFLEQHREPIDFLHIDTDTYDPCRATLTLCLTHFRAGSLVLFDAYLSYPGWQSGEHKALTEVLSPDRYSWIGFSGSRGMMRIN
jgi:predicted O-methyltransferase YrrM